jgi:hypothetical protein
MSLFSPQTAISLRFRSTAQVDKPRESEFTIWSIEDGLFSPAVGFVYWRSVI